MPAPPPAPLDPALLAAFRREAAAIIAQERGLTALCRIRLTQTAGTLGIPDDQIEEAIRALSVAEPAAPPSAPAERFRQRLRKDLSVKQRPILGPTMEAKIFAAAKRKYGLNESLAGEILGEVAKELGLTRITASDATSNLTRQIDVAAGSGSWLAKEAWDRLRSAGVKWGLELEVVDALIEERLAANKTDNKRRQFWTKTTLVGTGGAVLAVAVVLGGLLLARWQQASAGSSAAIILPRRETVDDTALLTPRWWDVPLSVDMAAARGHKAAPAEVLAEVGSTRSEERATGYERLVAQAASSSKPEVLPDLERVLAGCLALETDAAAAARLEAELLKHLPTPSAPLPAADHAIEFSLWVGRTWANAVDRAAKRALRANELVSAIETAIGGPSLAGAERDDRQRMLRQRIIAGWYGVLAAAASKQPAEVAALYPAVSQWGQRILSDEAWEDAETALLLAALPGAGEYWEAYERALGRMVSSPDPLQPLRLLDVLRRASEAEFVEHLSKLLVVRSGAEPRSSAKKDVISAVRKALSGDSKGLSLADRWWVLEDEVAEALAAKVGASGEEQLAQAVQLAQLVTLAVALAQGDAGLASFDARIGHVLPLDAAAAESGTNEVAPRLPGDGRAERLSKEQQRELAACLDDLGKTGAASKPAREQAWRRLAELAKEVQDISPAAAAQIANQALGNQDAGDFTRRLPLLTQLRTWKHLRLALGDKLLTTRLPLGQQRSLVEALTGQEPDAAATTAGLRQRVLASVLEELPAEAGGPLRADLLDAAQTRFSETYFERARLLGVQAGEISLGLGPAVLAERSLAKVASDAARTSREIQAARFVAGSNDLQHLAALQALLIDATAERLASRRPERALTAREIAAQNRQAAVAAKDLLAQICDQERALLRLHMLYAPEA